MTRKKARKLTMELSRRLYIMEHGNLKGFGKVSKSYRDGWRHLNYSTTGGYKKGWNSELMVQVRQIVGM